MLTSLLQVYLDKKLCGTVVYYPDRHVYPISCGGRSGRVVKIVQKNNYLTLAEVQVFGTGILVSSYKYNEEFLAGWDRGTKAAFDRDRDL